jgi:ribosomal protein L11 methyltransferase
MDYAEVILRVDSGDEEAAEAALLELGATGTSRDCGAPESSGGGDFIPPGFASGPGAAAFKPVEVVGYFSQESVPDRARVLTCFAALRQATRADPDAVDASSCAAPEVLVRFRPIRDWAAETRRSFAPFQPLPGLTVAPPWDRPARVDGSLIVLRPGAAFGLGTHPTTRSCLALMPPAPSMMARALDVGTGTGILAIRASQLGYVLVIGCDLDPVAALSARENVRGNGLDERVVILSGTLAAVRAETRFSLVLANLLLNPLLDLAEDLAARLAPEGYLVASGLQTDDAPALIERFARAGLRLDAQRLEEPWAALRFSPTRSSPAPNQS